MVVTKEVYDGLTKELKDNPQHPAPWLARAEVFLTQYPLLAVADSYKAYLLTRSDFKPRRGKKADLQKKTLNDLANQARLLLVHSLLRLDAVQDALVYLREIDDEKYAGTVSEIEFKVQWNVNRSYIGNKKSFFRREKYPWVEEKDVTRSDEVLETARKALGEYNLDIRQSTVVNNPQVYGVFSKDSIQAGTLIAPSLKNTLFKMKRGSGERGDETTTIKIILRKSISRAMESNECRLLDDELVAALTPSFHGVVEFSMKEDIKDIFEILRPRFHVYDEAYEFWRIMILDWRIQTNTFEYLGHEGIQEQFAFINHSCDPSLSWRLFGWPPDKMTLGALKDISEGEELFVSYISTAELRLPVHLRRKILWGWFGADCMCSRCKQESVMTENKKRKRVGGNGPEAKRVRRE
jgi:hypothetical protein